MDFEFPKVGFKILNISLRSTHDPLTIPPTR